MANYQFAGYFLDALLSTPIALLPGQAVTVNKLDATNATLYTTRLKAATASNPVTTDASGNLAFFADPGQYNLSVTVSGVTTTTLVTVPVDPQETVASVDVRTLGAKLDGTDDSTAINAAIAYGVSTYSGIFALDVPGSATCASALDFTGCTAVTVRGVSAAYGVGNQQRSAIRYTGTAAVGLKCNGIKIAFQDLSIRYTNASFTGDMIDLTGSQVNAKNCLFRAEGTLTGHRSLLLVDQGISMDFVDCMGYGDKVLYGKLTNGSFSNRLTWIGGYLQGRSAAPIYNPGNGWTFYGVTIESVDTTKLAAACSHAAGVLAQNLSFVQCWMGDDTAQGAWITFAGSGCAVVGGTISCIHSGSSIVKVDGTSDDGVVVGGGGLAFTTAVGAYAIDLTAATTPKLIQAGVMGFPTNIPTSLVNGTVPGGSIIALPRQQTAFYNDANVQGSLIGEGDVAGRNVLYTRVTGDTSQRFRLRADGAFLWGDGAGTFDGQIDRRSAGRMELVNADWDIATLGKGIQVVEGSNAKQGVTTLVGGASVVSNTSVTANSRILLTVQSLGTVGVPKAIGVTARTAGTSFTVTSADGTDTSVIAYEIFEPG